MKFAYLPSSTFVKTSLSLLCLAMLAGCGNDEKTHSQSGQSIVRVNDTEITVHQVNDVLQRSKVDANKKNEASKKIVGSLIDQTLLVEAAKDMKLDRNPNVMTAIEAAKKKLLAQAYIQQKVSSLSKPTGAEIQQYHQDNPDVFANRKVYAMDEVAFKIDDALFSSLEALSENAKSISEVINWLETNSVKFKRSKAVHTAERLPKKLLEKMSKLTKGELIFVNSPEKVIVGQLIDTRKQPVSLAQSKQLIEMALMNKKRQEAAKAELERLRKQANIVYLDEQYKAGVPAAVAEKAEPAVDNKEPDGDEISSQIEKGLSGL